MSDIDVTRLVTQSFYDRDTIVVARELLGKYLVRRIDNRLIVGKIVETEAYPPFDDPAAHTFKGQSNRTAICWGAPGYTYIYSLHTYHCLDIVTEGVGRPGSLLIRALEPIAGIELMQHFRQSTELYSLTTGPGKLCQALQITRELNGVAVTVPESAITIADTTETIAEHAIACSVRVGVTKAVDLPLRFYLRDNPFVSLHKRRRFLGSQ